MFARALTVSLLLSTPAVLAGSQSWKNTAPESFVANAQVTGARGGVAAVISIHVDRYTNDADHEALVSAFKQGGQAALLEALHKAPQIGAVKIGERSVAIRWARERAEGGNRRIVVVTGAPVFFAGAGAVDAPPTEGFDVAAAEFTIDSAGLGKGTLAAAARVKPGGPTGVQIEDYGGKRVTLVSVSRNLS